MKKILGTQLMILSVVLLLLAGILFWAKNTSNTLSFIDYDVHVSDSVIYDSELGAPSRVVINSAGIDLEIFPALINDNTWESTYQGISHLSTTPLPGNEGNSVLYGHNWDSLLGPLTGVNVYDTVDVIYEDGQIKTFKVFDVKTVSARETTILDQTDDVRLTIYTCSGFLDTKRFVVTALAI